MNPQESNKLAGELLKKSSPLSLLTLPAVSGAMGGTTRVKLANVGLLTRLFLDIQIPYNFSVAPSGLANKGVLAAVPRVALYDYDGTARHNVSAYLLNVVNTVRKKTANQGHALLQSLGGLTNVASGQLSSFRNPSYSLSTGSQTLRFILEVPVAADVERGDLRGMINAQFGAGELQLAVDFASALNGTANDDFVFNGGTMSSLGTPTVRVYQEYYLPQKVAGMVPLPMLDLSTVYEIGVYSRTSDNLAANQEKLIPFPVLREVNSVVFDYLNNSLLGGSAGLVPTNDLQTFRVYANGNNKLYETDWYAQNYFERIQLGHDLPQGTYFLDFANGPISTAIFGTVQLGITPGGSLTTPAVEVAFESLYAKGAALSGIPV